MDCEKCGTLIPHARLKALPETTHCVNCSDVKAYVAFDLEGYQAHVPKSVSDPDALHEEYSPSIHVNRIGSFSEPTTYYGKMTHRSEMFGRGSHRSHP